MTLKSCNLHILVLALHQTSSYLVVGKWAVVGEPRHQCGHSEHIIDETLHHLKETVSSSKLQRGSEHHVRNPQIQLSLKQRGSLVFVYRKGREISSMFSHSLLFRD